MAIYNITRKISYPSKRLIDYKCIRSSFRHKSSCSDDDDNGKNPPTLPTTGSDIPNAPTMYDVRKFGHCLPDNSVCPNFPIVNYMPSGIFRRTEGENLGNCAGKNCLYKNPEYFSYHHMSFFDIHYYLKKCRLPTVKTGRKPP